MVEVDTQKIESISDAVDFAKIEAGALYQDNKDVLIDDGEKGSESVVY